MDANDILNSPEMKKLFNEAKWLTIIALVKNPEFIDHVGEDVSQQVYEFLRVFYEHDVSADVVVEALEKLQVLSSKKSNEVSSSDLTSFIKVLNDIQKKKGET